jgi:hypothetical protein
MRSRPRIASYVISSRQQTTIWSRRGASPRHYRRQGCAATELPRLARPEVCFCVLSTSSRSVCLTSLGLPWADSGGPTENYAISDYSCSVSDCTLCSAPPAPQAPIGDCWEQGRICSPQRCSALPAASPIWTAGRGAGYEPGSIRLGPSHIDCGPIGTRPVSGLWERRA